MTHSWVKMFGVFFFCIDDGNYKKHLVSIRLYGEEKPMMGL